MPPSVKTSDPLGGYGFRLLMTDGGAALPDLAPVPEGSEAVEITVRRASSLRSVDVLGAGGIDLTEDRVVWATRGGASLTVDRRPPTILLDLPEETSASALVHPILSLPLSLLARWRGHLTLHGGAFLCAGGAWGVVGDRNAGKSSLLAELGQRGTPIVTDDLIVVDRGLVLAGPSCVDLRAGAAEHYPSARSLGVVGNRPRFRVSTPPAPARSPMLGIFALEWSEAAEVELIAADTADRLKLLYEQEYVGPAGPANPRLVMDLLGLPVWRLRRPRSWSAMDDTVSAIGKILRSQPHPSVESQA